MRTASLKVRAARWLVIGSSLAALSATRVAQAQAGQADRAQNVVFDDDLLNADLAMPFGDPVFTGHLPPARTQLIRPRTSFLAELYKTVEHL